MMPGRRYASVYHAARARDLLQHEGDLLSEARRVLEEAQLALSAVPRDLRPTRPTPANETARQRQRINSKTLRVVATAPAAAGLALLGAAVAGTLSGGNQHALSVGVVQPPATPPIAPSATTPSDAIYTQTTPFSPPLWLAVPRLHTSAPVVSQVQVITSGPETGLLDAPPNYHDLGWYRHGNSGLLVLDGHVGYRTDPGPLAFIGSLAPGDLLTLGTQSGQFSYHIIQVATALKGQLPASYFTAAYDADVMLITCDYASPFENGHFANNVYVVAAPSP